MMKRYTMLTPMNRIMCPNSKMRSSNKEMKEEDMEKEEIEVEEVTEVVIEELVEAITIEEEDLTGQRAEAEDKMTMMMSLLKSQGKSRVSNGKTKKRDCILINNLKRFSVKMKNGHSSHND